MNPARTIALTALFTGFALHAAYGAGVNAPTPTKDGSAPEEFVVTAKALEDLRLKIKLAENEVFARFNEINSDDSHDIHCYDWAPVGSKITRRRCLSNAWRTADQAYARALLQGMQSASSPGAIGGEGVGGAGGYGESPGQYVANQLRMEQLITKELTQLAYKDPVLHEAMLRVGQARLALETVTGSKADWTLYRDVPAGDDGLPFGAKRLIEVRVGEVSWNHPLTARTFTIGSVTGRVKGLRVQCAGTYKNLAYMEAVEWNVPEAWSDCSLVVRAKPGTTFALYEF